ncbi:uncharacterized protein JN550_008062 [Neoarthrinium moseri]|uniref:uncharacterized protein n=1 Tax=Neoarthrinium moseri TaxID=1658444 RepID=UPI001FDE5A83|nr:uncharacterized protein JN550_008062 [Neoarthrinium moseri]KAI1865804.1 hypothetical protein JN550_008062 [Neoarthrinium moseri]
MESKQPAIYAVLFITFVLATTCLALRIFSRFLKKTSFWWDDFFAIGCYVIAIAWLITCPVWIGKGLGLHITDVTWISTSEAVMQSKLILWVAEIVYAFALFFAKMSILFFYWRIFSVTNLRYPIMILMGASIVWIIIRTFMSIFHCIPVQAFWDLTITNKRCDIDDKKFFFGSVLAHMIIDVVIVTLPVVEVQKLQLRKVQRLGIIAMFTFGILICAAAVAIIVEAARFDDTSADLTWNLTNIVIWASAEVNLVTVSCCFPTIRPGFMYFFGRFVPNSTLGSNSNGYGSSHRYVNSQSHLKSIKLGTVPKSRSRDEASSKYNLADSINGDNGGDFDAHALDRQKGVHAQTIITGRLNDDIDIEKGAAGWNGIAVRKETSVRISDAHLDPRSNPYASDSASSKS